MKLVLTIFVIISFFPTFAGEKAGIKVPDTIELKGKKLFLNGMGIRRATWLNIKVYVGSLYVQKKSQDPMVILDQPYPKHINMTFVRDVDKDSIIGKWNEGFNAAVKEPLKTKLMPYLREFNSRMMEARKKQKILIDFLEDGVEVEFNGKKGEKIGDKAFSKALLSIWFVNARDEDLRDEMLGKK
ncbi:MAG: chalcone isomerase family protein [Halobacteriovoraceae bacterium]|nr:chalcone isomerase family protein [Halobacteriovoraceae bacterium]